jgi:hypothetical protein
MRLFLDPAIKSQDDDWGFIQVQRYHFHAFWVMPSIMKTVVHIFFLPYFVPQRTGINILDTIQGGL